MLAILGAAAFEASIFVPWFSDNSSMAEVGVGLAFRVPSAILVLVATALTFRQSSRPAGGLLLLLLAVWNLLWVMPYFLAVHFPLGATLTVWAIVLLAVDGLLCLVVGQARLRVDLQAVGWAAGGAALAGLWILGRWLPWTRTSYQGTPVGATQLKEAHTDCCVAFSRQLALVNVSEAGMMALIPAAAIVFALASSRVAGGMCLAALGMVYASPSASWLVALSSPSLTRSQLTAAGFAPSQIDSVHLTGTASGLPGGWIALGVSVALVLLGVIRILAAIAQPAHRGHEPTPTTADGLMASG